MIRKLLFTLLFLAASAVMASPALAYNPLGPACTGAAANSATCNAANNQTGNPIVGPGGILSVATNIIALVAGVAAVLVIMVSGLSYVTSAGNSEAATKARQRILGAVIGLLVVSLSWVIVSYVNLHILN